tara:strand:- start:458 stop:1459 length:1002 start_codon:yes stop_codon:yes gene_type:complete
MSEYKKLQGRETVYVPSKDARYLKKDTKEGKSKGVRAFLQRLIPGGETGMENVVDTSSANKHFTGSKVGQVMTAEEVDEYNKNLLDDKIDYTLGYARLRDDRTRGDDPGGGVKAERSEEVAKKVSTILDNDGKPVYDGTRKDAPTEDIRDMVKMIAEQKANAGKDVEFLKENLDPREYDYVLENLDEKRFMPSENKVRDELARIRTNKLSMVDKNFDVEESMPEEYWDQDRPIMDKDKHFDAIVNHINKHGLGNREWKGAQVEDRISPEDSRAFINWLEENKYALGGSTPKSIPELYRAFVSGEHPSDTGYNQKKANEKAMDRLTSKRTGSYR